MEAVRVSLFVSAICLFVSACGAPRENSVAPSSQKEASQRFIVRGSQAQNQAVIEASESFRVLSKDHGVIEVSGLSYHEIKAIAPQVSATQNQYFENKKHKPPFDGLFAKDLTAATPQAAIPPILEGCNLESPLRPEPLLQVSAQVFQEGSPTMELGQTIFFTGAESRASEPNLGFEVRWDVMAPASSLLPKDIQTTSQIELTPDAMGLYQVLMVIKDENDACNYEVGRFMVTANPEIQFPSPEDEKPTISLDAFSHLPRVQAHESWDVATGKGKVIAILDTGLNYYHPAIRFNLAINEKENQEQTGVDEDENGFVDDVLGWDFINGDNNPFDDEGHGSHVSGLAASHIFGLAKDAKVLPVKIMNAAGGGDLGSVIAGIYYAADQGADVINASLQRLQGNIPELIEAVAYAHQKGVVVVTSSGNDSLDLSLEENQIYPGEVDVPNVINVAAIGAQVSLASYSNFGKQETDVAAPGGDQGAPLFSLAPMNPKNVPFIGSGGTSMAAPIVAGIAAQMLEANENLSPEEIREIMMSSGEEHTELVDVVGSGKSLNALEALQKSLDQQMQLSSL